MMNVQPQYLPKSRLFSTGLQELSSLELLALALGPGQSQEAAFAKAYRILNRFPALDQLNGSSYPQLRRCGLSDRHALALLAAHCLFRRSRSRIQPGQSFSSSRDIFQHFQPRLGDLKKESFWTLLLDGKNRILRIRRVSEGSLTASLVHPREVFRNAILEAAVGVLFVHNHPSGDPSPSQEDLQLTDRLVKAGKILGIRVLDHVIIGRHAYFSFADQGLL